MRDQGLAQIGDTLTNLCYSLTKSIVLERANGVKVRDSVLARAIRSTSVYDQIGRRTDIGRAADAYEAILAWLWLKHKVTIKEIVEFLVPHLNIDHETSRKEEGAIAAIAFQSLLEHVKDRLPNI